MSSAFVEFPSHGPYNSNEPFVHPIDASEGRILSSSNGTSRPTSHRVSLPPRNTYPRGSGPPPVEPVRGIPTPAPNARGVSEFVDEAEYMTVEPAPVLDASNDRGGYNAYYGSPAGESSNSRGSGGRGRRFVGGFVANLKRLPRAIYWPSRVPPEKLGRDHEQWGRPRAHAQWATSAEEHGTAPPYGSPAVQVMGDNVLYVEALDMPSEHPAMPVPPPSSYAPSRGAQHLSPHGSGSPRHTQSQRSPSHLSVSGQMSSSRRSSTRRTSRTSAPTVRNPDPESDADQSGPSSSSELEGIPSPGHPALNISPPRDPTGVHFDIRRERPSTSRTGSRSRPRGETGITAEPETPVLVEPKPAPDYARMQSPIQPRPEPSFPSQLARIQNFFRNVSDLPWMSTENVTVDFVPRTRAGPSRTWYAPRRHASVDLLAGHGGGGGSGTRLLVNASGQTFAMPGAASSATLMQVPSSSLGHGHGYGGPAPSASTQFVYPALPHPPPPMFMYPAPVQPQPSFQNTNTPQRTDPDTSLGTTGTGTGSAAPSQGYPVYVVALPSQIPLQVPAYLSPPISTMQMHANPNPNPNPNHPAPPQPAHL